MTARAAARGQKRHHKAAYWVRRSFEGIPHAHMNSYIEQCVILFFGKFEYSFVVRSVCIDDLAMQESSLIEDLVNVPRGQLLLL
jgi:hypothetical protein